MPVPTLAFDRYTIDCRRPTTQSTTHQCTPHSHQEQKRRRRNKRAITSFFLLSFSRQPTSDKQRQRLRERMRPMRRRRRMTYHSLSFRICSLSNAVRFTLGRLGGGSVLLAMARRGASETTRRNKTVCFYNHQHSGFAFFVQRHAKDHGTIVSLLT